MWWTRCIPIRLRCWNNRSEKGKYSDVFVGSAETITSSNIYCASHLLPRHHAVATARTSSLPGKLLSKSCFEVRRADVYSSPSHFQMSTGLAVHKCQVANHWAIGQPKGLGVSRFMRENPLFGLISSHYEVSILTINLFYKRLYGGTHRRSRSCWRELSKTSLLIASETRPERASPCPFPPILYHLNTFPSAYTFSHFRDVSESLTLSS